MVDFRRCDVQIRTTVRATAKRRESKRATMVTLRSRQAVSRAAAIGASKTAVAGRATNRNKAAKATGRQLRTRSAGVVKTRAGPGSVGAKRASAPLIVVESPANTPSKSTSEPLAIAKGSTTPLRVYSPRRQRPSRGEFVTTRTHVFPPSRLPPRTHGTDTPSSFSELGGKSKGV